MATFMDLSLFEHFSVVFVFLMVFVIVYGFLSAVKIFKGQGGEKGLYAIIALAVAFLLSMTKDAFSVIVTMTPWFTVLIIFLFLIFFVVRMWAGDDDEMFKSLIKKGNVYWILIIVFILILVVSLSSTFGQRMLDNNPQVQALPGGNNVMLDNGSVMTIAEAEDLGYEVVTSLDTTQSSSTATTDFSGNVMATIIHPKVLGMILFMIIAFFAVIFLAKSGNPEAD